MTPTQGQIEREIESRLAMAHRDECLKIEAATIERCAQVAENHPDKTITCNRIAAEIRALKEKQ